MSERLLFDKEGKPIGYELPGKIIGKTDCGVIVEIRPRRTKSAVVEIGFFELDFRKRPHAPWNIGDDIRVLVTRSDHVLVPKDKS